MFYNLSVVILNLDNMFQCGPNSETNQTRIYFGENFSPNPDPKNRANLQLHVE